MSRIAVNRVELNVEVSGSGPALLPLHGFTGSTRTWDAHQWPGFTTIAVDLLGHGASDCPPDPARYRMERCVEDINRILDHLAIERTAVLGYSMGGRIALRLALAAPDRISALILESASPGIDDQAEREERVHSDGELANAIERDGVAAFVAKWEALPLFASQARLPASVRAELRSLRLANNAVGLANSLRGMGAGEQEPAFQRLGELRIPVLLLAGARDEKYCSLAQRMATALPCAQLEIVPEAGHAIHLEQPSTFQTAVHHFLQRTNTPQAQREGER